MLAQAIEWWSAAWSHTSEFVKMSDEAYMKAVVLYSVMVALVRERAKASKMAKGMSCKLRIECTQEPYEQLTVRTQLALTGI